jgi:hypothetical protein
MKAAAEKFEHKDICEKMRTDSDTISIWSEIRLKPIFLLGLSAAPKSTSMLSNAPLPLPVTRVTVPTVPAGIAKLAVPEGKPDKKAGE